MSLSQRFFARPSEEVASELIGRRLYRKLGRHLYEVEIVETGAYEGFARRHDEGLLSPAGVIYIFTGQRGYKTLTIGTERKDEPAVVTVRQALERSGFDHRNELIDGPGKLTQALHIDKSLDGKPINGEELWIDGDPVSSSHIVYISPSSTKMAPNCLGYYRLKI